MGWLLLGNFNLKGIIKRHFQGIIEWRSWCPGVDEAHAGQVGRDLPDAIGEAVDVHGDVDTGAGAKSEQKH